MDHNEKEAEELTPEHRTLDDLDNAEKKGQQSKKHSNGGFQIKISKNIWRASLTFVKHFTRACLHIVKFLSELAVFFAKITHQIIVLIVAFVAFLLALLK